MIKKELALVVVFMFSVTAFADYQFRAPKDEVFESMDSNLEGKFTQDDYLKLKQGADDDYFGRMDKGITLPSTAKQANGRSFPENSDVLYKKVQKYVPGISKAEAVKRVVKGRNNWIVYTGGNDRFWDFFNQAGFGGIDLLKTISNHPDASTTRSKRWEKLGLVNEPCFKQGKGRKDRYGLWLDVRESSCAPDPFENAKKYPGVKIGSRGKRLHVGIGEVRRSDYEVGGPGPNPEYLIAQALEENRN